MEDRLITDNTKPTFSPPADGADESAIAPSAMREESISVDNTESEVIEKKRRELLQQEQAHETHKLEEQEITQEQLSLSKRLLNWRTLVPLVVVVVAMIFFAKKMDINLQQTWADIRSANLLFFLAAFGIYYLSFPTRALRWRLLLENIGYTKDNTIYLPHFWKLVEIIYIAFFANVVVPAKLGDLYRAYLLRQEINVPTTRSFGTVLAERLLDLIVLLLLFIPAIIISLHGRLPAELEMGLEATLGAVFVGIAGLFVLRHAREPIARLVPGRFRPQYYHLQEGTLGSFRRLPVLTALTTCVWLCESLRFFFVAMALSLIPGDPLHILTAAMFVGLGEALLTIVPTTGGGVGLVEAGMLAMIILFSHSPHASDLTAAAILLDRTVSLFSIMVIGFFVFLIAVGRKATKQQQPAQVINTLTQR
jgi:uncharacterized membrane protein YbhN (UPF0104 family)